MSRNQMHTWVNELMGTWLDQVYDPELLDDWIHQIELRKKTLGIIDDDKLIEKLKRGLKDSKRGDVIWTMESLQSFFKATPGRAAASRVEIALAKKPEKFWHRATFLQYQPRNETLWLAVPWPTSTTYLEKTWLIPLKRDGAILTYQPSRTEYEVRLRVKERQQRRP